MKKFSPYVAIIPSRFNKGVVIIPGGILDSIIPYIEKLDEYDKSCQKIKDIVSEEFYDFFIKTYTEEQFNFYSHLKEAHNNIEAVYKRTETEGISFTKSIDSPFPVFFMAMKIFLGLGKEMVDWMPQEIRNEFGNLLIPYSQIEGIYILHNESRIEQLTKMFNDNVIPFVLFEDCLVIRINTSAAPVSLQLFSSGEKSSSDWLPKNIENKYSALKFENTRSYYIDCQKLDSFSLLTGDLKECGYFIWEGDPIRLSTYASIANQFIKSEKRYPLRIAAKKQNYYSHWSHLLLTQYDSGGGYDFSNIDTYLDSYIKPCQDCKIPKEYSINDFIFYLSEETFIHHLFFDDLQKFGCFAFNIYSTKYYQYFASLIKNHNTAIDDSLSVLGISLKDLETDKHLMYHQLSRKLTDSLISYYAWLIKQDKDKMEFLRNWGAETTKTKICAICGKPFILKHININPYCATGLIDCCFQCNIVEFPNKDYLPQRIIDFTNACGFFPTETMTLSDFNFMSRIDPCNRKEVLLTWARMGKQSHVAHYYGTWFEGLVQLGILPNNVLPTERGIMCVASDNHICLSLAEMKIDDWLHSHNISHEKEPFYPYHPILNISGLKKGDWKVGNTYIEYFGLAGDEEYDERSESKLLLAEALNIRVISIFPKDLKKLDEILFELLP